MNDDEPFSYDLFFLFDDPPLPPFMEPASRSTFAQDQINEKEL